MHIFGNGEPGHCTAELWLGYLNAQIYGEFNFVFVNYCGFGYRPADFNRVGGKYNLFVNRLGHRHYCKFAGVGLFTLGGYRVVVNAYGFVV